MPFIIFQISRVSKMLADEYGTASNIKSRVNRLSVLGAITSVQHRLKLYPRVPGNGLVVYCGTIVTDEGKEKKVNLMVTWPRIGLPLRPISLWISSLVPKNALNGKGKRQ